MLIWIRLAGVSAVVAALWFGYGYVKHIGYNQAKTEMQAENLKLALAYAQRIVKAEGERDANQTIVDRIHAESRRVQVHFPVCPTTPDTRNQNRAAGLFSDGMDKSFARLQERTTELFKRCEELNLDAIKVNAVSH